ncbi:hypothetical protein [Kitasatospora sp. DSM 101779]|uniref:hypothetical protein n=1 Tax=Kitasatospora sp. DSM 101779 TaxID=2853165 RepID=UPI0021D900B8|nr:hypothetical protein [Kitasatospora sp. DSM 101779]MCU7822123.1 hypothetical protein [Kitasatospora sp. DSM 101779]
MNTASGQGLFAVGPEYLAAAEDAGLLHRLDGLPVVAGPYTDPLTGEAQCLVEHADPALLADPGRLLAELFERHPDCTAAVLRIPAGTPADPRLQPLISYLHLTPDAAALAAARAAAPTVRITEDRGEHRDLVRGWLATAVSGAQADLGTAVAEEAVRAAVEEILHTPARRTWLVRADGHDRPIGHATAVTDAVDDASGTPFVDLVDILIEEPARIPAAQPALVAVAAAEAARHGLPLVGHVCHHRTGPDLPADPGAAVVAALRRQGWQESYAYRRADRR